MDEKLKKLVEKRKKLREEKKFGEADAVRDEIASLGYRVIDDTRETRLEKRGSSRSNSSKISKKPTLVLFGSGEISPTGRQIHEEAFGRIGKEQISVAIVSTPAGFQPNVRVVHEEIKDFLEEHLKNFHPRVSIIYANTRQEANNSELLKPLENADYIFLGPGSPTYAVRNLEKTLLLEKLFEQVQKGATLSLASAATIAFSKFALPVYEIYKAGEDLRWEKGLNFYSRVFAELTIIPHFNNNEGGEKNDTSRCFMGEKRFDILLKKLPEKEEIWGIDEQTGVIIDLESKKVQVLGKGEVRKLAGGA